MQLSQSEPSEDVVQGDLRGSVTKEIWSGGREGHLSLTRTFSSADSTTRVLLVHGFAQNRYTWDSPGRSFSNWLALSGVEVWSLELSGHGRSRTAGARVNFEDYVEDLVSVIEHFSGDIVVIGHSLGGSVAYAAAGRTSVKGVVGLAAIYEFCKGNRYMRAVCRLTTTASPLIRGSFRVQTSSIGGFIGRIFPVTDLMGYFSPVSGWWPGSMERDILAKRLKLGCDWTSLGVWLQMSRWASTKKVDFHRSWADSGTPVLAIAGDKDSLAPIEDVRGAFDDCSSDNRRLREFGLYEDGIHWGHLDIVLGRDAQEVVWPEILQWAEAL